MNDNNSEQFYALCEEHLRHAREKHPKFAKKVSMFGEDTLDLAAHRYKNLGSYFVEDILLSEVYEFLAEIKRGNMARAREEAADIVAVVLRASEGDHLKKGGSQ